MNLNYNGFEFKMCLVFIIIFCCTTICFSQQFTVDEILYNVRDTDPTTVEVIEGSTVTGGVDIPITVDFEGKSFKVVAINNNAFKNKGLTSVTIPKGVTLIGQEAFVANQLESVTIPDSVTEIGNDTFRSNKLKSVTIPLGVKTIGNSAFARKKLTSVTIPDKVSSIGAFAFFENNLTEVIAKGVASAAIEESSFDDRRFIDLRVPTRSYNGL